MIKAIVTDIEGTTTSISFVKEVLFPYARNHIEAFVRKHQGEFHIKALLEDVNHECGKKLSLDQTIRQLIAWIDDDKKITPLKALQGLIWQDGYQQGAFKGHLYDDVVVNLQRWHARGIELYVYSSGSEQAQKLLLGYTDYGDVTPLFSGYFDTRIGAKQTVDAYHNIAATLNYVPSTILFLSDIKGELDAARKAGFATCCLVRDGLLDTQAEHQQVRDFNQIDVSA